MTTGTPQGFELYSEDKRDSTRQCPLLKDLLVSMLKLIDPDVKTHHLRERLFPLGGGELQTHGSYYKMYDSKSPGDRDKRLVLIQRIAAAIARGRVVIFHVDADAVWSDRKTATVHRHLARLRDDVRIRLTGLKHPDRAAALEHWLIIALPHWCIESWCYANTARLLTYVTTEAEKRKVRRWAEKLSRLDEEREIKERLGSVRDQHNLELVGPGSGFPAQALREAGTSWASTVSALEGAAPVRMLLVELDQLG